MAALTPLSVDGMIVAASTALLADSRAGRRGGLLPWALLVVGSAASLAANVAVAQPTLVGRVIAAWPSFALISAYEMLMRQVRHNAAASGKARLPKPGPQISSRDPAGVREQPRWRPVSGTSRPGRRSGGQGAGRDLQRQAWGWALANRAADGSLPSGREIARQYDRHERWGRLVKRSGSAGTLTPDREAGEPGPHLVGQTISAAAVGADGDGVVAVLKAGAAYSAARPGCRVQG